MKTTNTPAPTHPRRLALQPAAALALSLAGLALLAASTGVARAQSWPDRPVRLVVPFAPGGAADRVARVTAEQLTSAFGQQFIADNRPGAGGSVGYEIIWRAAPDGYTLGTAGDSATLPPLTQKGVRWDPRDYSAISLLITQPLVLAVHTSVPAKTLQDFIAYARAKPGTLSFGSSGHGHPQHLTGELIRRTANFDMVHVPYKGGGAAITDLVGGQIPVVVLGSSPVIPFHRAGKVRILAVTSARRSATLPDIPTLAEAGVPGIDVSQWIGLVGPPKLPRAMVMRVNVAVVKSMQTPAAREALESVGFEVTTSTPEQMAARFRDTLAGWERLLREIKLKVE